MARRGQMRRSSKAVSALLLAVFALWAASRVVSRQAPEEQAVKRARLTALYQAYRAYEVAHGTPAKTVDDLTLATGDAELLKRWLELGELGASVVGARGEDLAAVMAYEADAPRDGGLVMFYDGSVKPLSAAAVTKLVGKKAATRPGAPACSSTRTS
jgi:hypothetical protein